MKNLSVKITPDTVVVCGKPLAHKEKGSALLTELYRTYVGDYPKFFKMDTLCKLGFVASELLLKAEGEPRFVPREDRAIILYNKHASLQADTAYQKTIQDLDNFFPSPAAFVYTLPNIVTGEIAIRNKYYGETSFFVIDDMDASTQAGLVARQLVNAFSDPQTLSIINGWVDCTDEDHFEAKLFLLDKLPDVEYFEIFES
ncbi:MAG: hypothetical protein J6P73_05540 [Bacteroidales bacterium]|nr:hypothetical protein [Bacteroidales bacterium]